MTMIKPSRSGLATLSRRNVVIAGIGAAAATSLLQRAAHARPYRSPTRIANLVLNAAGQA